MLSSTHAPPGSFPWVGEGPCGGTGWPWPKWHCVGRWWEWRDWWKTGGDWPHPSWSRSLCTEGRRLERTQRHLNALFFSINAFTMCHLWCCRGPRLPVHTRSGEEIEVVAGRAAQHLHNIRDEHEPSASSIYRPGFKTCTNTHNRTQKRHYIHLEGCHSLRWHIWPQKYDNTTKKNSATDSYQVLVQYSE